MRAIRRARRSRAARRASPSIRSQGIGEGIGASCGAGGFGSGGSRMARVSCTVALLLRRSEGPAVESVEEMTQLKQIAEAAKHARAGERVMASVSRFLAKQLRLTVNEAKSAVARPEERKFLGFSIANDGSERRIAPKALGKFKMQIRDMTRRTRGISLPRMIEELAPYLIGWRGYFGFCQTPRVLTNLEA